MFESLTHWIQSIDQESKLFQRAEDHLLHIALASLLMVSCGKDTSKPEADPLKALCSWRWVNRTYITENDEKVEVTTTFKFNEELTYNMTRRGKAGGTDIESYTEDENGTFEMIDDTLTVTPVGGDSYTLVWDIPSGSGNLHLTWNDGTMLEFEYTVPQGYA